MAFVLCDQCAVHLKCDAAREDCPKRCSETCFDLGFRHAQIFDWWTFRPLIHRDEFATSITVDALDARIVADNFSWGATSNSSQGIGSVADNAFC